MPYISLFVFMCGWSKIYCSKTAERLDDAGTLQNGTDATISDVDPTVQSLTITQTLIDFGRGAELAKSKIGINLAKAKLLKKEREKDYTLEVKKGEKISKIFSYLITKYGQSQLELDSVSNGLVYDYLKNHQNQKIQKLAEKLKALVPPIQTKSENPSIGDILNHANFSRKILVPVKKKLSNQLPNQARRQKSSVKKVSGIALKSKVPTKTSLTKTVHSSHGIPIKSLYFIFSFFRHMMAKIWVNLSPSRPMTPTMPH